MDVQIIVHENYIGIFLTFQNCLELLFLVFIGVQVQFSPFSSLHAPHIPASHPQTCPLWLCPCVLHTELLFLTITQFNMQK